MALRAFSTRATPQTQPMPGVNQVRNSAGGYVFAVDDWQRLDRFLILGVEGGTYYIEERTLTRESAGVVLRCLEVDGVRTVRRIVEVSEAGRAPKNDPALFALALAAAHGDEATRRLACQVLPRVARTGTHLLHFMHFVRQFRGNGRLLRRGIAAWYATKSVKDLAYQVVKYQQRDGWSHRDLLRLRHLAPDTPSRQALYHWIAAGWPGVGEEPHPDEGLRLIWAFERAKRAATVAEVVHLVRAYRLPREAVPTRWLAEPAVWEALLDDMPLTALIRNLATLTRVGLLKPLSNAVKRVVADLGNPDRIRQARVHPMTVLFALQTYEAGRSERGDTTWKPVGQVVDALNEAFYLAFANVEPTGQRYLLAIDASGSMASPILGSHLKAREAATAMAVVTAHTEPSYGIVGFTMGDHIKGLPITPRQRVPDALRMLERMIEPNGTDCALPMRWALQQGVQTDVFVVYTDSETWHGGVHPVQALREYRMQTGIPAKLVVVGMTSNGFSLADPNDAGMLDVVGFDASVPEVLSQFAQSSASGKR